jgi:hypothetical protein
MDAKKQNDTTVVQPPQPPPKKYADKVIVARCIYDEICSKDKLCGDCAIDIYENERYAQCVAEYNLDQKMLNDDVYE